MVQEELRKPIPKVQAGQVIIHFQGWANQACNRASCHVGTYALTHSWSRSAQQMISETPCLCLASVYAQDLLDYLKQFDKDGKGALSKEEVQELMRGRIRCGWDGLNWFEQIATARSLERSSHFKINTDELMTCGVCGMVTCEERMPQCFWAEVLPPGSELSHEKVQAWAAWKLWWMPVEVCQSPSKFVNQ